MPAGRYRVIEPTIAMFDEGGRYVAHPVPAGAIILVDDSVDGDRLTDVTWDGQRVLIFTRDLRTRAVLEPES